MAMSAAIPPIQRVAVNTAAASANKIHDDAEAQRYGYRGGLVPGVTLYAYLTQLAAPYFGPDWLGQGAASIRLIRPVYEGEMVTCEAEPLAGEGGPELRLRCLQAGGQVAAEGSASLPRTPLTPPADLLPIPRRAAPEPMPDITVVQPPQGVHLAPLVTFVSRSDAAAYAEETDDPSPWYRTGVDGGGVIVPSGWIAGRQARLLRHSFAMGPSIHVASVIQHLAPARADAEYVTGGIIRETYERKGNTYLTLDALTTADGVPVAYIRHTTIYRVRTA